MHSTIVAHKVHSAEKKWLLILIEKKIRPKLKVNPSSMGASLEPMTSRHLQHKYMVIFMVYTGVYGKIVLPCLSTVCEMIREL